MTSNRSQDLEADMKQYLENELVTAALNTTNVYNNNTCSNPIATPPSVAQIENVVPQINQKKTILDTHSVNYALLQFQKEIAKIASITLKIPLDRLDLRENVSRYGIDSIIVTEVIKCISDLLTCPIAPTVFFEARNLEELAKILFQRHQEKIAALYITPPMHFMEKNISSIKNNINDWIDNFRHTSKKPITTLTSSKKTGYYEPVAIISMNGIFPNSNNLDELEKNLSNGFHCISEIPLDRWDWRKVFGNPKHGEFTDVKYGGFISDIDKFDALFFGISPREAELMDPQHRLFIQCVWKLIEAAGYAPKSLSGKKIGMFIGINLQDYAHMIDKSVAIESLHLTSLGHMFCPNRLSFYLDFHGPSQVIDTACSSSLVALHRAVMSIQHENCEMAIAGGANLIISPDMHIMYSKVGMICADGRCKTFSKDANGYVRSEGIGAVLLKSLKNAERDNDNILAVICGSAENHGGMSTSLTAPNPKSQAALIVEAHKKTGGDPRRIGYIECHGTGTALGDPIEINGLKMAFEQLYSDANLPVPEVASCGLGSVKSNIGHTETTAGIASIIKTILALKNHKIYRSIHCDHINPLIDLTASPFYIAQTEKIWLRPIIDNHELPRCAGISSFGAGGSNAHVVLEEYITTSTVPDIQYNIKRLILLSARTKTQLTEMIKEWLRFIKQNKINQNELESVAYTTQVGREAMMERLAIIVTSVDELQNKLENLLRIQLHKNSINGCYIGSLNIHDIQKINHQPNLEKIIFNHFKNQEIKKLAELWINGANIHWSTLHNNTSKKLKRIVLPTYPFAKNRHWLNFNENTLQKRYHNKHADILSNTLHPLVQQNTSNLSVQRFSSTFNGQEFFLNDHQIMGKKIFPAVAYLEMARAAVRYIESVHDKPSIKLKNIIWLQPFTIDLNPKSLHIDLSLEKPGQLNYRIYSLPQNSNINNKTDALLHSQGIALLDMPSLKIQKVNIHELCNRITQQNPHENCISEEQCYQIFNNMSIDYGPMHRCLKTVYFSNEKSSLKPEVLAKLQLPKNHHPTLNNIHSENKSIQFVLHPGLIDSGLQACIGLILKKHANIFSKTNQTVALPFSLESFSIFIQPPTTLWVWIRYADDSSSTDKIQKLNIDFYDEQGTACISMKNFCTRHVEQNIATELVTLIYNPVWAIKQHNYIQREDTQKIKPQFNQHIVIICNQLIDSIHDIRNEIINKLQYVTCEPLILLKNDSIEQNYTIAVTTIFNFIKQKFIQKHEKEFLLQIIIVIPEKTNELILLSGLTGLLQTAERENSKFKGQLIEFHETINHTTLKKFITNIYHDSLFQEQKHIRYDANDRHILEWQETKKISKTTITSIPWKENGVYLITGGSGGLGFLFSIEIGLRIKHATIILCSRNKLSFIKEKNLKNSVNLLIEHYLIDITDTEEVHKLIKNILKKYHRIDGILHCAGLLQDNFIQKKSIKELTNVLNPKVKGTTLLDQATKLLDLDFFVLFASAAGALGSAGQSDYAVANAFMDAFSHYRNTLVKHGLRYGHTLAIDWPLWKNGGMRIEKIALTMMQKKYGMLELPDKAGITAFEYIISSHISQALVIYGISPRIQKILIHSKQSVQNIFNTEIIKVKKSNMETKKDAINITYLQSRIENMLVQCIVTLMKFSEHDIDKDGQLHDYGFDSITFTELANKLNQDYKLELTPTIFFEYSTISSLAQWLCQEHNALFASKFNITESNVITRLLPTNQEFSKQDIQEQKSSTLQSVKINVADDAIAIIGMSGCFPMSSNLEEFWKNLLEGKNCIREIPLDRWNWKEIYGDPATEANKTNIKWGGFIDGIGNFDARFFGISPREAQWMDPQQRLLMQYVWKAIEDAGYAPTSLSNSNTALFIGTAPSGYGALLAKSGIEIDSYSSTGEVSSIGPNRMSYFLNLHGPSEPIETACSSSLVAIHRAITAIKMNDCQQAIAGGINLIINPETHISFNKAGMLSEDGRCKTFSKDANGYVRGEGVGMLFLKKLSIAEQDGDTIYGVIRGSAENHGGHGSTLTAPNPRAQAELIKTAYTRANLDIRTVTYIETHGTGTVLGDPIEVDGLKMAFQELTQTQVNNNSDNVKNEKTYNASYCALGSVKTNIGHLELAAGVASVIKVLLQIKYKTLVKNLNFSEINPYIHLHDSPFYILTENRQWTSTKDHTGKLLPRRAGISSFGFGGVNAHLIIEEYLQKEPTKKNSSVLQKPSLILLSAKTQVQLQVYAKNMLEFVSKLINLKTTNIYFDPKTLLCTYLHTWIADILNINSKEIDIYTNFEEYNFDAIHRATLLETLKKEFKIDLKLAILLESISIDNLATVILEQNITLKTILEQSYKSNSIEKSVSDTLLKTNKSYNEDVLKKLAYTFQVGRDAMDHRLGIIANTLDELKTKLHAFIQNENRDQELYIGQAKQNKRILSTLSTDDDMQEIIDKWVQKGKFHKVLDMWSSGMTIHWNRFYNSTYPRPIRITGAPGYPFEEKRYWIDQLNVQHFHVSNNTTSILHPLLHENISTLKSYKFRTHLKGTEFFLEDHKINEKKILPGVVYLEMAFSALTIITSDHDTLHTNKKIGVRLYNIAWVQPFISTQPSNIIIELNKTADFNIINYQIFNESILNQESKKNIYNYGAILINTSLLHSKSINPIEILKKPHTQQFKAETCYTFFEKSGLIYGPAHRAIQEIYTYDNQILARIELPEFLKKTMQSYTLHPSIMDAALQSCIGLVLAQLDETQNNNNKLTLPFALDSITILNKFTPNMWAKIQYSAKNNYSNREIQKLDIDLYNENGLICVEFQGFTSRLIKLNNTHSATNTTKTLKSILTVSKNKIDIPTNITLKEKTIEYFKTIFSKVLKYSKEEILTNDELSHYGIDSITIMELTTILETHFGSLSKTLFFEYLTISDLVDYFIKEHKEKLENLLNTVQLPQFIAKNLILSSSIPTTSTVNYNIKTEEKKTTIKKNINSDTSDIAIIGLSGRYPQANNIEEFWENIKNGRNCITEIPNERWNWREYYNITDKNGYHTCKWGGFIKDVDKFDPLFFNISPSVAEYMDPQERLFLEHTWMAMEDAGYCREDLQKTNKNYNFYDLPGQVGVYVGVMYSEYQFFNITQAQKNNQSNKNTTIANFYASIANRVSHVLNLHGPSIAIDTMCSSSLTAIHLACQDLRLGNTNLAFAGGVNINIHPNKYSTLSRGKFISTHGDCRSFGIGGDGYVPGEGVGVVILKRLNDAEHDNDHIYGVIKSSALSHGGKTNSFSVPNPIAQKQVINRALQVANIDANVINYIEAHGTGTALGDPIEIAGLSKAFSEYSMPSKTCWIGSVKSNIGHLEAAAGVASLTKVLLQLREGQIAPSLHSKTINPNIDFSTTPFHVNQELRLWPRVIKKDIIYPRTAGISSFGAGGSNAHIIVAEHIKCHQTNSIKELKPTCNKTALIVISAMTAQQRRDSVSNLLAFILSKQNTKSTASTLLTLEDIAYTLQIGRETMPYRIAFIATSLENLIQKLQDFLNENMTNIYIGHVKRSDNTYNVTHLIVNQNNQEVLKTALMEWSNGAKINWHALYTSNSYQKNRISLPTYPFARERYWLTSSKTPNTAYTEELTQISSSLSSSILLAYPEWKEQKLQTIQSDNINSRKIFLIGVPKHLIIPNRIDLFYNTDKSNIHTVIWDEFCNISTTLLNYIREWFHQSLTKKTLFQVVINIKNNTIIPNQLLYALVSMLKTACLENTNFRAQLIDIDQIQEYTSETFMKLLNDNAAQSQQHIRYRAGVRQIIQWRELTNRNCTLSPWKENGIYLITGGAGNLGLIFAREIAITTQNVRLILIGRSPINLENNTIFQTLKTKKIKIEYHAIDITNLNTVTQFISSLPYLNGIIHSAGVLKDKIIYHKTNENFKNVLAPKILGAINLDLASRNIDLDFIIFFSSISAISGNLGQVDYATANGFLDVYATYRNQLIKSSIQSEIHNQKKATPRGHTLSINWPLWVAGGMQMNEDKIKNMQQQTGMLPLQTKEGIAALYQALYSRRSQIMVLQGDVSRLRSIIFEKNSIKSVTLKKEEEIVTTNNSISTMLTTVVAKLLNIPIHRIETHIPLEQYGVDSIALMTLTTELEKVLGSLPKTLFFEYPTIDLISVYLTKNFSTQVKKLKINIPADTTTVETIPDTTTVETIPDTTTVETIPDTTTVETIPDTTTVETIPGTIAIIGMSGQFPLSPNLEAFWENLKNGIDCITEIPIQRWDYRLHFNEDKGMLGKSYCKWGGFLNNIDQFDPQFFKILPHQAELLDPQERLFLETTWNLLESSAYLGETLKNLCQSRVGVFVGAMSQQYHTFKSDIIRESLVAISSNSSIANRVSYFFNFKGPSMTIDTMCSSSLVAVHLACDSLLKNECKLAIAGGVNLSIHPKKFIGLSAAQLIGSHINSRSFSNGDGYLPAEAVGAVLLKPLAEAIADNDTIIATIKGSTINHNGQSNGYYIPSATAQAELISENFTKHNIDARTISYIESAANGAVIGDAIEINALVTSFLKNQSKYSESTIQKKYCAIGSVKSNIGHAEAASGISQLIKVLLQLKYKQLVPTIKATPLNPNINFSNTPFYLQEKLEPWLRPVLSLHNNTSVHEYPLRATISSFGAGGSNAHMILEEYEQQRTIYKTTTFSDIQQLIILSAKTKSQLTNVVHQLLIFIQKNKIVSLTDLAYTLQIGREAMDYRLAFVIKNQSHLIYCLQIWLNNDSKIEKKEIFTGNLYEDNTQIKQIFKNKQGLDLLDTILKHKNLMMLGFYWVKGIYIPWKNIYTNINHDNMPRRITLPLYPFNKKSYWLKDENTNSIQKINTIPSQKNPLSIETPEDLKIYVITSLANLLEVQKSDILLHKSLQDFGADSILTTKWRRILETDLQVSISAKDLVTYSNLTTLIEYINKKFFDKKTYNVNKKKIEKSLIKQKKILSTLSEEQKGLWFLQKITPKMTAYNVPLALRFQTLNIKLWQQACDLLLQIYPILSSVFIQKHNEIYRIELPEKLLLTYFKHEIITIENETAAINILRQKSKQVFNLEHGPLWRITVLSPNNNNKKLNYVLITAHHLIFDGRSAILILKTLLKIYCSLISGATQNIETYKPKSDYNDFVYWQKDFLTKEIAQKQYNYWLKKLTENNTPPVLNLPYDYPRPQQHNLNHGNSYTYILPIELTKKIQTLTQLLKLNPSVLFLGVLQVLLHRYCAEDDIAIGMPFIGRPEDHFDNTVGYFVNMQIIRCYINPKKSVAAFLKQVQLILAEALDNANYPYPLLIKKLNKKINFKNTSSLFNVIYAYQNFIQSTDFTKNQTLADNVDVQIVSGIYQEGSHDLALEIYNTNNSILLKIDYSEILFHLKTIKRIMTHYTNLLISFINEPNQSLETHEILSKTEYQRITNEWSTSTITKSNIQPQKKSISELFQLQAKLTPSACALWCEDKTLSYYNLDHLSTFLALYLCKKGLTQGITTVGVYMPRGITMVIALLAIFKAGGIYIPLAYDYPIQRLQSLIKDSKISFLLTEHHVSNALLTCIANISQLQHIVVDTVLQQLNKNNDIQSKFLPKLCLEDAAYVIYTSGSTGIPKGVIISHAAISHHSQIIQNLYELENKDSILQFAAINIDASLEQLLPGLLVGARIVLRPETLWSPHNLRQIIAKLSISIIDLPPSYLHEILLDTSKNTLKNDIPSWNTLSSLRLTIVGGEILKQKTLTLWRHHQPPKCRLINAYGPTETTITSTVFEILNDNITTTTVPIGKPLPGETVYILDKHKKNVPIGVCGELYIGGAGLALGYLNQPDVTQKKFVKNPIQPNAILYKTGDAARWLQDGNIEFLGRFDTQIKIRGLRIECGEIETILQTLDGVKHAVVIQRRLNNNKLQEDLQLYAFVEPLSMSNIHSNFSKELKNILKNHLPLYMIPNDIIILAKIPLMQNGKIDRIKLKEFNIKEKNYSYSYIAPRTPTEKKLTLIWQKIFNREKIGIYDNYFELGGHSLLSLRLMTEIKKIFGKDLQIESLFSASNIATQAILLLQKNKIINSSPLILMRHNNNENNIENYTPWFWMHAVGGTLLCYQKLTKYLNTNHQLYGLQQQNINQKSNNLYLTDITKMAEVYISAIRKVQPNGPYNLAGWSMGGIIAYEIAKQLIQFNEKINTLILIESYTPIRLKNITERQTTDFITMFKQELNINNDIDLDKEQEKKYISLFKANIQAINNYHLDTSQVIFNTHYIEKIGLFITNKTIDYGWKNHFSKHHNIKNVVVPGDHYSVLCEPYVKILADKINTYID